MNTKRLTVLAMLIAIYCVLSIFTIQLANFKFTLEAFPILVAALLYGPIDGLIVGGLGSFIYQLLFFGITPTTPLWVLPHALSGLLVGAYARRKDYRFELKDIIFIAIFSAILVTLLNLLAIYADSKLYGYYSKSLVFGNLALKLITGPVLAVIYSMVLQRLLPFLNSKLDK